MTSLRVTQCKVIRIPQSRKSSLLESGIPGFGIRNPLLGIWNPANYWNPESMLLKSTESRSDLSAVGAFRLQALRLFLGPKTYRHIGYQKNSFVKKRVQRRDHIKVTWLSINSDELWSVVLRQKQLPKHDVSNCLSYKLSYIGFYPSYTRKKLSFIISKCCKITC